MALNRNSISGHKHLFSQIWGLNENVPRVTAYLQFGRLDSQIDNAKLKYFVI